MFSKKLSIKATFFIITFAICLALAWLFKNTTVYCSVLAILVILGYIFIIRPIVFIENILASVINGDYPNHINKWLDYSIKKNILGKLGNDFNLLLGQYMVSRESLNILLTASKTITSHADIEDVTTILLDLVYHKMMMSSVSVIFPDENGILHIKASRGLTDTFVKSFHVLPGESFVGKVFVTKKTVVINDVTAEKSYEISKLVENECMMSFVHIPIIVDNKVVGVFNVNSKIKGFFDASLMRTLSTITDYMAIAINNSRMYQEMREFNKRMELEVESTTEELTNTNLRLIARVKEMKVLNDIIFATACMDNTDKMFTTVIDKIKLATSASIAGFMIYDEATNALVGTDDIMDYRLSLTDGKNSEIVKLFENVSTFISNELFKEADAGLQFLYKNYHITSIIVLPLVAKKVVGLFILGNKATGKFSHDDLRFLSVVASQIAELISRMSGERREMRG